MPSYAADLTIQINGVDTSLLAVDQPLVRAVVISLFTWRRAKPDDPVESGLRWGWWGDGLDGTQNDQIGSRLWLLIREKITPATINRARNYAEESLQWLLDDGVATRVAITVERQGLYGLSLHAVVERVGSAPIVLRFADVWSFLNV